MLVPVIMAGGSGTRLWPMSRKLYPKQYLSFGDELTMLQKTLRRLEGLLYSKVLIVCNEEHRFMAAEQIKSIIPEESFTILLEPEGRNTAPAIALAALKACNLGINDPVLLVLPADHIISDVPAFHESLKSALTLADQGKLVMFGIPPIIPETGYGYIQRGGGVGASGYSVVRFVEKPDHATACNFLESGDYYWNSGMFVFHASKFLGELGKFQPEILDTCRRAIELAHEDSDFTRVDTKIFCLCPNQSIDYGIMEHTKDAVIIPMDAGWCDVGSWSALYEIARLDNNRNSISGDVISSDTCNSYILSDHRLVATIGVENLIIVETKDAVLIADKQKSQNVKEVVNLIQAMNRNEHITHREVFRPWGSYDCIDVGEGYQVKRITVQPGAKLSVQMHHHRAEHWVVVSGTARVTNGDKSFLVTANQSTFIPVGQVHALENPGLIPLELIEVQSGQYLDEDDIVRFEDKYGRA